MGILSIGQRAKKIDVISILDKVLNDQDTKDFFIKMNTQDQLFELGEDNRGVKIEGNIKGYLEDGYSINTINGVEGIYKGKREKGQPFDRVTLNDTGAFYNSWTIKVQNLSYVITADDLKDGVAITSIIKNGVNILGLNEENTTKFENFVIEKVVSKVISALFD